MTTSHPIKSPKKLIEVALPLDAINEAAARENYIYKGNPSAIHKWWAQRPLAAARAVIFAQLVNDPGYQQGNGFKYGKNKKEAEVERQRLFEIIKRLVKWENTTNEEVLEEARAEIRRSWREVCALNKDHPQAAELFNPDKLPGLHDPFAGGGTIPLEAQRLGIEPFASDLNPVAVLINKALIEIPPSFRGCSPVGPVPRGEQVTKQTWIGSAGLAEDVRRYGDWMSEEAGRRIGHLYPKVEITSDVARERDDLKGLVGQKLTVLAWIWARTVRSPNPAFSHVPVPLASTFVLSSKEGKQAFVEPQISGDSYRFVVRLGKPPREVSDGTKAGGRGATFRCLISGAAIDSEHIRAEGQAGRLGARLMAVVAEAKRGRVYLSPTDEMERIAASVQPQWRPDIEFFPHALGFRVGNYGMTRWSDLFTPRQLVALTTFTELLYEVRQRVLHDAIASGMKDDGVGLNVGGAQATAYAEAISTYLAFALSKASEYSCSLTVWYSREDRPKGLFARQAIPMVWDFAEQNILGDAGGSFRKSSQIVSESLASVPANLAGHAIQADAATGAGTQGRYLFVSTDPPYYDNIGYADLSDFFYVWLRRSQKSTFPGLFAAITSPKSEELVATPYRHGGREKAEEFFLRGMTSAMHSLAVRSHPAAPLTIYYAFKQSETEQLGGTSSTGWETFLDAVIHAGLAITGTWPMRTERESRSRGIESNALASSIVLVCRKRPADAPTISRRQFLRELNTELPLALDEMTKGSGEDRSPVAPVDLSQAIIGPGMAIFSKYTAVLEADGTSMSVRTALRLINRFLAEDDFDHDTQFCLHWFEQYTWAEGPFGEADVLARAKGTAVDGVVEAGVVKSSGGKVRLLRPAEYPSDWDARTDTRLPMWEALHQLIRALRQDGESGAAKIFAVVKDRAEPIRQLAYRMYTLCERRGLAEDARGYNDLVTSWGGIEAAAGEVPQPSVQLDLFGGKR